MKRITVLCLLSLLVLVACGSKDEVPGPYVMDTEEFERWEIDLVEMRIEKNEEFSVPQRTPLRETDLEGFEGLNYYFPVPELRFRTPLIVAAGADTVKLTKRRGEQVDYLKRGHVAFTHEGVVHKLTVFGPAEGDEDFLWLPYLDKTSGHDTYSGGRYLDLTVDDEGMVDLDFNYAYNPLCDYNPDKYNCTLPPLENRLDIAVEAGEKTFGAGE